MSTQPELIFRRLDPADGDVLAGLAATLHAVTDVKAEYFGLDDGGRPPGGCEVWGLYIRGVLSGAAWYVMPDGGYASVRALVLGKRWWKTGLGAWMFQELAKTTELAGGPGTAVTLAEARPALGEALEDAGFIGPQREEEAWPLGEWKRTAGWKVIGK